MDPEDSRDSVDGEGTGAQEDAGQRDQSGGLGWGGYTYKLVEGSTGGAAFVPLLTAASLVVFSSGCSLLMHMVGHSPEECCHFTRHWFFENLDIPVLEECSDWGELPLISHSGVLSPERDVFCPLCLVCASGVALSHLMHNFVSRALVAEAASHGECSSERLETGDSIGGDGAAVDARGGPEPKDDDINSWRLNLTLAFQFRFGAIAMIALPLACVIPLSADAFVHWILASTYFVAASFQGWSNFLVLRWSHSAIERTVGDEINIWGTLGRQRAFSYFTHAVMIAVQLTMCTLSLVLIILSSYEKVPFSILSVLAALEWFTLWTISLYLSLSAIDFFAYWRAKRKENYI